MIMYFLWVLFADCGVLEAQTIQGKTVDKDGDAIGGVAVVLQTADSVYVDAVVTDSTGVFRLHQPFEPSYRLLFQHLLYESAERKVVSADIGTVVLSDKPYALDEVTVKAERPQVRVEGGKLTYDVPHLVAGRAVTNAYDVIRELPGITESTSDNVLQLAGAGSLNVLVNGQLTTLSSAQLQQMLKNIPVTRVQKAEVMYNAPAKYNIKGALVNIVLSKAASDSWQGEAGVEYLQRHYAEGKAHGNLLFSSKSLTLDLLLNGSRGRSRSGEEMIARHTLGGKQTAVEQYGWGKRRGMDGTFRLGVDYTFGDDDRLSAVYYLEGDKATNTNRAKTSFASLADDAGEPADAFMHNSVTRLSDHSALHNLHVQYDGHLGVTAGADYTHYRNPGHQHFLDRTGDTVVTDLSNPTNQRIDRLSLFANHTRTFGGYQMNYGLTGSYTASFNRIDYLYGSVRPEKDLSEVTRQKEYTADLFTEVSKSFGQRFSVRLALKGEYYKADHDLNGSRSTLWSEWALFPTASLNYTHSSSHILQFNVSSDKTYPPYWATSAQNSPLNPYTYILGNPQLKPFRTYSGQLVYILRQKYTFVLFCNYQPDYFTQMAYQSDTEVKNILRFENVDYSLQNGLQATVPFSAGTFWNARLSLMGVRLRQKATHFHAISFDRKTYVARVAWQNTFSLSTRPNVKLTIDGWYLTPGMIQGLFDMGSIWDVSTSLKWTSKDDRASLILKATDIFRSGVPRLTIDEGTQWSRMHLLNDRRCVSLSFIWKFGGYKAKEHKSIDTSRFGK